MSLRKHTLMAKLSHNVFVIPSRAHPNYSKCTVTIVICVYMLTWSLRDVRCLMFILPWSQKHFTMALLKYFKSSLCSAKDPGISESRARGAYAAVSQVLTERPHQRGQCKRKGYTVFSSEQRVAIGRYAVNMVPAQM